MQVVLPLYVNLGPLRSRHKDGIRCTIHLLGERCIRGNGERAKRD